MDGVIPAHIAQERQARFSRQLAAMEQELAAHERSGIDTEATPDALLDRLGDPGRLYRDITDPDRRRYNQAWFSRLYIDAIDPDEPVGTAAAQPARTPLSEALDGSRRLVTASGAGNAEADPSGSASCLHPGQSACPGFY